uniref:Uncharacterized protein n=1 Tax=Fagus sylvatica TaxID=28930 RepID=A0A2N9EWB6_FAGSY
MTYYEEDGGEVVPELKLRIGGEDVNGGYVKLSQGPGDCEEQQAIVGVVVVGEPSSPGRGGYWWKWFKLVVLCIFLGLLAAVFIKWVGPFFMDKVFVELPSAWDFDWILWVELKFMEKVISLHLF